MATARRIYVYLLSGISLAVLLFGLVMLIEVLFTALGMGSAQYGYGYEDGRRQQLTLGAALVAVGLPVWLIHWTLAQRSVRPGREGADTERSGAMRGLYIAAVLSILLGVAAAQATDLLRSAIERVSGGGSDAFSANPVELAGFLVAGLAWAYHLAVRLGDWRAGPIHGAGAWLPRLYLYGAIGISLVGFLALIADLASLGLRAVIGPAEPSYGLGVAWWVYPMASSLSGAVVSGGIWLGHWWYAGRLVAEPSTRVGAERPARLRLAYFAGMDVVLAAAALFSLSAAAAVLLERVLGVEVLSGGDPLALALLSPLVAAVLFAGAWWVHRTWFEADTAAVASTDAQRPATADRLDAYGHALLGLAFVGVSAAWLIGLAIEAVFGSHVALGEGPMERQQLAVALPALVLGAAVWVWAWSRAQARWRADRPAEAESAVRRAALLAVLGASVLGAIGGFGFLFYRLFGSLVGVSLSEDVASDLSRPLGVIVVAVIAGVSHGLAIRRDQSARAVAEPTPAPIPAPASPVPAPEPVAAVGTAALGVDLHLSGPSEHAIMEAIDVIRRALPPGTSLQVREPPAGPD